MERTVTAARHYTLIADDGEVVGELTCEDAQGVGDLVACGGHTFEVLGVDDSTLRVRRVI